MRKFVCVLALLAITSSAMGQLMFVENFDNMYTPPDYGAMTAPWYFLPTYPGTGNWVGYNWATRSGAYSLIVNNAGYNGADKGNYALLDGGAAWNGCDEAPLIMQYFMYVKGSAAKQRKFEDIYVELTMGDVQAPPFGQVADPPIPVLAYCHPWNDDKTTMCYFDGEKWTRAGWHDKRGAWEQCRMIVNTDTAVVSANGTYTIDRVYKGGFDRIAIRTIDYYKTMWTAIDDVMVAGGYPTAPVALPLDILPNDCPNEFTVNLKGNGVLPMTIFGSEDLDVTTIDLDSINIAGVAPVKVKIVDDAGTPGAEMCDCSSPAPDGWPDLELKFKRTDLTLALGLDLEEPYTEVEISVTGALPGCLTFEATDCVTLMPR